LSASDERLLLVGRPALANPELDRESFTRQVAPHNQRAKPARKKEKSARMSITQLLFSP